MPRVPIASGGAPECRPSTLDTPPRAAARHPDGCGATDRNTSLVRPTGSPHRWVSSLRRPRRLSAGCAPHGRAWRLSRAAYGQPDRVFLALGVLAPRTFVCAHEGTVSSHLPRARFVVHERLCAGYDANPLRGKQQGLGTELSRTKDRGMPSRACVVAPTT